MSLKINKQIQLDYRDLKRKYKRLKKLIFRRKKDVSRGEYIVRKKLNCEGVNFEQEKTFPGCCDKRKLRFDFYIPKYKILIEVQGRQHYEYVPHFHKNNKINFLNQQKRDQIKRNFCEESGYQLIEIPDLNTTREIIEMVEQVIPNI